MIARALLAASALALAASAAPSPAAAHGIGARADLPVPSWLFAWGAAVVLVLSFLALAVVWSRPQLEHPRERAVLRVPAAAEVVAGLVGVGAFALVVVAGLAGTEVPSDNLAPTAIYVAFWVGVPIVSALVGDVFRAISPWRALARGGAWALRRAGVPARKRAPLRYPDRLGRWPAVAGVVAFGWMELVYVDGAVPFQLAVLALGYAALQIVGMGLFGVERWSERGDAFGVAFGLFARLSALSVRERTLVVRRPLAGTTGLTVVPGTVALLCALIGVTTFDGASNSAAWISLAEPLQDVLRDLGASLDTATHLVGSVGLAGSIFLVGGVYALGVSGMRGAGQEPVVGLSGRFVHSLIPIALAYALAHYFSLLVFQGQALPGLLADPLGRGIYLVGAAGPSIDYGLVSAAGIWYVQVGVLVAGHVAGLLLAHDRALATWRSREDATRSQHWMLAVMVGYTGLGLWLLSAVGT